MSKVIELDTPSHAGDNLSHSELLIFIEQTQDEQQFSQFVVQIPGLMTVKTYAKLKRCYTQHFPWC